MNNLAVIPARGGSKGVPGKNLRVLAGRSLLDRAIDCGRQATLITDVAVSTDDPTIAEAAVAQGAIVIERPDELASDEAATPPVVAHAVEVLADRQRRYDNVVLLQPPAPLRTGTDVDTAMTALANNQAIDSVVSVYRVGDNHPGRMYTLGDDGVLVPLFPDQERLRRQELPPVFHRNGAIYATRVEALLRTGELLAGPVWAYEMDPGWTVNIDTPDDLLLADHLVSQWDAEQKRRVDE